MKYYKTKQEAEENCGLGQKLILEGNFDRRWRVVEDAEYNRIIARGKDDLKGCDTQTRQGHFTGI